MEQNEETLFLFSFFKQDTHVFSVCLRAQDAEGLAQAYIYCMRALHEQEEVPLEQLEAYSVHVHTIPDNAPIFLLIRNNGIIYRHSIEKAFNESQYLHINTH